MYVVNTSHLLNTYEQAVMFVYSGAYDEAKELFEEIKEKEYHDTAAYISLCEAHRHGSWCLESSFQEP